MEYLLLVDCVEPNRNASIQKSQYILIESALDNP